jgi:transmembrane sensor
MRRINRPGPVTGRMNIYRTTKQDRLERASREAAEWLHVMNGNPAADERAGFMAWVQASPLHLQELLMASMLERELSAPGALDGFDVDAIIARARAEENVVPLREALAPARTQARRPRRRLAVARAAMAAGLALFVAGGTWLAWRSADHGTLYATTLGEQRVITLADGSVVTMAPSSRIEVELSPYARDIRLRAGEADFKVAHDKTRPFRVHAGASTIQAVGTQFRVNRLPSGTVVAVTEGVVKLTTGHLAALDDGIDAWIRSWQPAQVAAIQRPGVKVIPLERARNLSAGETAHITRNGRELALSALDRNEGDSALPRRLIFHDDTLADVAAEFNRYNAMQIVVEGDAARMQRYSGVFNARDSASFLEFLTCCSRLSVTREGEQTVVRLPAAQALSRR